MGSTKSGHRVRVTIAGLLGTVALAAVLINAVRPLTRAEAIRVARRRFQQLSGASAWSNPRIICYRASGEDGHAYWITNFLKPVDGGPLVQISVDERGRVASVLYAGMEPHDEPRAISP